MLIKWLERLAARSDEDAAEEEQAVGVCWPCVIMGSITFGVLAGLVYWGARALVG